MKLRFCLSQTLRYPEAQYGDWPSASPPDFRFHPCAPPGHKYSAWASRHFDAVNRYHADMTHAGERLVCAEVFLDWLLAAAKSGATAWDAAVRRSLGALAQRRPLIADVLLPGSAPGERRGAEPAVEQRRCGAFAAVTAAAAVPAADAAELLPELRSLVSAARSRLSKMPPVDRGMVEASMLWRSSEMMPALSQAIQMTLAGNRSREDPPPVAVPVLESLRFFYDVRAGDGYRSRIALSAFPEATRPIHAYVLQNVCVRDITPRTPHLRVRELSIPGGHRLELLTAGLSTADRRTLQGIDSVHGRFVHTELPSGDDLAAALSGPAPVTHLPGLSLFLYDAHGASQRCTDGSNIVHSLWDSLILDLAAWRRWRDREAPVRHVVLNLLGQHYV